MFSKTMTSKITTLQQDHGEGRRFKFYRFRIFAVWEMYTYITVSKILAESWIFNDKLSIQIQFSIDIFNIVGWNFLNYEKSFGQTDIIDLYNNLKDQH